MFSAEAERVPGIRTGDPRRAGVEKEREMGISLSIFLIATGAILAWAVSVEVSGIDVQVAGVILLVVGVIGFLTSLVFWSSWGGFGGRENGGGGASPQTTIVKEDRT
jgi:hypothetical protein